MSHKIRILPKRRVLDVDRLAEALLDLIAELNLDRDEQDVAGGREPESLEGGQPAQKGSAA